MSTPDSRLNAAERAALADLEAAAAAADPALASRLRGSDSAPALGSVRIHLLRAWLALLVRARQFGAPLIVLGLSLIVVGLSRGLAVSVTGVILLALGLRVATDWIPAFLDRRRD
jgi:hypothetical protein